MGTGEAEGTSTHRGAGLVAALVSAAAFGASGPFVKPLLDAGWSPSAAVTVRAALGALVLVPFGLAALGWRLRPVLVAWRRVVAFGVLAVAGTQLCYFAAVERLPVGVALLIEYLGPVLLVGFTWVTTRTRPPGVTLVGAAVATGGLFLVLDLTGASGLDPVGVAWALGAAVGVASYFALSAQQDERLPPVALAAAGLLVGAVVVLAVGLSGLVPLAATGGRVDLLDSAVPWWVPMAVIVVVSTSLAYATGVAAAGRLGARVASFVGLIEVVFAVLLSWWLLDQVPTVVQALGGALIVAGVVLVRAGRSPDDRTEVPPVPVGT